MKPAEYDVKLGGKLLGFNVDHNFSDALGRTDSC